MVPPLLAVLPLLAVPLLPLTQAVRRRNPNIRTTVLRTFIAYLRGNIQLFWK
jgi:hypothetical protein